MDGEDIESMPPFPFPEKLFPPGTFPKAREIRVGSTLEISSPRNSRGAARVATITGMADAGPSSTVAQHVNQLVTRFRPLPKPLPLPPIVPLFQGMRFSNDFNLPPAVEEMLEKARKRLEAAGVVDSYD